MTAPGGCGEQPRYCGRVVQKQSDLPKEASFSMFKLLSFLQELPTPEDHGPTYACLASRYNKIMTGQTAVADQGMLNRSVLKSGRSA